MHSAYNENYALKTCDHKSEVGPSTPAVTTRLEDALLVELF